MTLDLANNHRQLIEEIIKSNDKYYGNEDLLESFCSDVYKKSYLLLDSVTNIDNLKNYLEKVVDTSITSILKLNNREDTPKLKPSKPSIQMFQDDAFGDNQSNSQILKGTSLKKQNFYPQPLKNEKPVSIRPNALNVQNLARDIFAGIEDPKANFPDVTLNENVINRIISIVFALNVRYPEKNYFQIFYSRHARFKKQAAIANELKITQGELSKRYFELIKLVKEQL